MGRVAGERRTQIPNSAGTRGAELRHEALRPAGRGRPRGASARVRERGAAGRAPRPGGSGLRCGGSGGRRRASRDGAPYISEECPCPAPRSCTRPGLSKLSPRGCGTCRVAERGAGGSGAVLPSSSSQLATAGITTERCNTKRL